MRIGGAGGGSPIQDADGIDDRGGVPAGDQAAPAPADDVFQRTARSAATKSALVRFVMAFRTDVRDYYEPGDESVLRSDRAAAKAFFDGAKAKPVRVPAGVTAHKALKLEGRDPRGLIEGDVILLFDRRGKLGDALLQVKEGRRVETYKMSEI